MRLTVSKLTLERIERIAKISRGDPSEVLDAALALWEDAILKLLPPEKRSAYFDAALGYEIDSGIATVELANKKADPRLRDPYVEFTDRDNYDTGTI